MDPRLSALLQEQYGVVSRRQALEAGLAQHDLDRLVRRRLLARLWRGVYVDHTGEPTPLQRMVGALLLYPGSALTGSSALRVTEGPGTRRGTGPVELLVGEDRHVTAPAGIVVVRSSHVEERVQWHPVLPRVRYEHALLDVAGRQRSDLAALGEISRGIQSRCTTAGRLVDAAAARERTLRGTWLRAVLLDVRDGVCSVLEHGHLTLVERPHGLSAARRQVRDRIGPGTIYRDVEYVGRRFAELDGQLFHDTTAQRDKDFDRDLVTAAHGGDTVRLSYGQVFDRPCWTALHLHRWIVGDPTAQLPRRCGPSCGAAERSAA